MKLARSEGDGMRDVDDARHCFFSIHMLIAVFSGADVPFSVFSTSLLGTKAFEKRSELFGLLFFKSNESLVYNNCASSGMTYYNY